MKPGGRVEGGGDTGRIRHVQRQKHPLMSSTIGFYISIDVKDAYIIDVINSNGDNDIGHSVLSTDT